MAGTAPGHPLRRTPSCVVAYAHPRCIVLGLMVAAVAVLHWVRRSWLGGDASWVPKPAAALQPGVVWDAAAALPLGASVSDSDQASPRRRYYAAAPSLLADGDAGHTFGSPVVDGGVCPEGSLPAELRARLHSSIRDSMGKMLALRCKPMNKSSTHVLVGLQVGWMGHDNIGEGAQRWGRWWPRATQPATCTVSLRRLT